MYIQYCIFLDLFVTAERVIHQIAIFIPVFTTTSTIAMADAILVNSEEIASSLEPFYQQGDLQEQLGSISLTAVDKEGKTCLRRE